MAELNFHFKRLTAGAPGEAMAELGEALLAIHAQREAGKGTAPDKLRRAYLSLMRHVASLGTSLNPEQRLFMLSGALADSVALKNAQGERVVVNLLSPPVYAGLLTAAKQSDAQIAGLDFLLEPLNRMGQLGSGDLLPLDLNRPGRYRPPGESTPARRLVPVETLKTELEQARSALARSLERMTLAGRRFGESFKGERLAPVLSALTQLAQQSQAALQSTNQPAQLAKLELDADPQSHPLVAALLAVNYEVSEAIKALDAAARGTLTDLGVLRGVARALSSGIEAGSHTPSRRLGVLSAEALKLVERDLVSVHGVMVQLLVNSPQRTAWSSSRILLTEHTERFEDPLNECYATPGNLAQSIAKAESLHPDCFTHDRQGRPVLPPIVIEPGAGVVKWYDDRFVLGFVCTDPARRGSKLSLSPVDLAVLQIYGLFLARGDLYNYRGDRNTGNFIADYAGEIEQKAVAKFAGDAKKLTYTTATEVKDAASREDAVQDYIEFIYAVFNGLPVPKRITPRKIGVILTYCLIGDAQNTATLALRYVTQYDPVIVRDILLRLANRNARRVLALISETLLADPQLAARYRRDTFKAVHEVMGHEFAMDLVNAGVLKREGLAGPDKPAKGAADSKAQPEPAKHDYFDV